MKNRYSNIIFTSLQLQSWLGSELINSKEVKQTEKVNVRKIVNFSDNMLRLFKQRNRSNKGFNTAKDYVEDEAAFLLDTSLIALSVPPKYREGFIKQLHDFQQKAIQDIQKQEK